MARLRTIGYEAAGISSNANAGAFEGTLFDTVPTIDTATVRSGVNSLRCNSGAGNAITRTGLDLQSAEIVLDRTYFFRVYLRVDAYPTSGAFVLFSTGTAANPFAIWMTSAGRLQLSDDGGAQIGSDSGILSLNTWYRIEISWKIATAAGANDSVTLRLDGVEVASNTAIDLGQTAAVTDLLYGWNDAPGANKSIYLDDVAFNDDQGASQNTWPGEGKIVVLKAISDAQAGSWTGGSGGTSNLFDAVNNTPPIGTASESNTTQIESADTTGDNSTDEYRANLTTYTNAGVGSSDTITLCQAVVDHGEDASAGTKTGSFLILSNPAQGAADTFTFGDNQGALGTWPANWRVKWGTPEYAPSVALGTSPVLRVRKTDAGSAVGSVDFLGVMVEYVTGAGGHPAMRRWGGVKYMPPGPSLRGRGW